MNMGSAGSAKEQMKREFPLVSVIIPAYNAARFVTAAVQSVYAQTYPHIECIVVDDGSTDDTARIASEAEHRVRVFRKPNGGVASARNAGLANARGQYVAFLDADDLWHPNKLELQVQTLIENPEAACCCSRWEIFEDGINPQWLPDPHAQGASNFVESHSGWIYTALLKDCIVWTSTFVGNRELLQSMGGFDEGLAVGEDYDFWLRCARVAQFIKLDHALAGYRQHPGSITQNKAHIEAEAMVLEAALARWGFRDESGTESGLIRHILVSRLANLWRNAGHTWFSIGETRKSREALARSLSHKRQLKTLLLWARTLAPQIFS